MSRKKFNAKECISAFNTLRKELDSFTSMTIRHEFKIHKIPSNHIFWDVLRKSDLINRLDFDLYQFTNPQVPIHYLKLEYIYKEYQDKVNSYVTRYKNKKQQEKVLNSKAIEEAIQLLKANGFEILKIV